jgi:MFS family permease
MEIASVQRRTLRLLFITQIVSGVGVAVGASVGALLAADIAGVGVSGLAQSAAVIGTALFAIPATAIVNQRGRRPSLALLYLIAALGAIVVLFAATRASIPLLFPGFFLFGAATTANFQARYAAVDMAPPTERGRHLSLIVWATTMGAVLGPSLAPVAGTTVARFGIPTLAGPYFFSMILFTLAIVLLLVFLRPDPAVVARAELGRATAETTNAPRPGMGEAFRFVASHTAARLGVSAMAVGNVVMIGVMAMTPVHIRAAGHDAAHTLSIVGLVLSFHIAGMYAFSPIFGWLTDRLGRRPVIFVGLAFLLAACALAGNAGDDTAHLAAGLMVLGLGWSATMVAGSTLLSESVSIELRASAQGFSDLVMGLAGASAGAISGVIVAEWGYPTLALLAAVATVPLIVLVSLPNKRRESPATS